VSDLSITFHVCQKILLLSGQKGDNEHAHPDQNAHTLIYLCFRRKPLAWAVVALLVCTALGMSAAWVPATAQEAPAQPKPSMPITVVTPSTDALSPSLSASGSPSETGVQ
jgi:hypothetical protein